MQKTFKNSLNGKPKSFFAGSYIEFWEWKFN